MKGAMRSFYHCFYLLDACYAHLGENDLGAVLGAMSPVLFGDDGMPVDRAYLNYWTEACAACQSKNILAQVDGFLSLLERRFGFQFPKTKQLLGQEGIETLVIAAAQNADDAYRKYVKGIAGSLSGFQ